MRKESRGYDIARFDISVGQPYYEGDEFYSQMYLASQKFKAVIINMDDTLQRYNHRFFGLSKEEAHTLAIREGDKWIERNQEAFSLINPISLICLFDILIASLSESGTPVLRRSYLTSF